MDLNKFDQEQDLLLSKKEITEKQWYSNKERATTDSYLSKTTPWAQCGHSGSMNSWIESRILPLLETLNKSGSFIDVGCANGFILESLELWTRSSLFDITYYGVEISEELIKIAKKRMMSIEDHFFVGNIMEWNPNQQFDYVRSHELNYVPSSKQKKLFLKLYNELLKPNGRLIIGSYTVNSEHDAEDIIKGFGYVPNGFTKRSYHGKIRKTIWYDKK